MNYKVILTILDNTNHCEARTLYAIDLAKQHEARLVGVAPQQIVSSILSDDFTSANSQWIDKLQAEIESDIAVAIKNFRELCKKSSFESFDHKTVFGTAADVVRAEAIGADLIVLTQKLESDDSFSNTSGVIEHAVMVTARPGLVIPALGDYRSPPKNILIGWRNSRECSHAIRQSIPMLQNAEEVQIVEVSTSDKSILEREKELDGILNYLRAHNVEATFSVKVSDIDPANVLLSYSCDIGADALVMGGYGHSRLREWALGGATRTMLETMTLPVLMAH